MINNSSVHSSMYTLYMYYIAEESTLLLDIILWHKYLCFSPLYEFLKPSIVLVDLNRHLNLVCLLKSATFST